MGAKPEGDKHEIHENEIARKSIDEYVFNLDPRMRFLFRLGYLPLLYLSLQALFKAVLK